MNTTPTTLLRKPKLHFEIEPDSHHVTFDDGKFTWRNFPWNQYEQTRWEYEEPGTIHIVIGDTTVRLHGHNLAPLLNALQKRELAYIRAISPLETDRERDTFVTEIHFSAVSASPASEKRVRPRQMKLL